MGTQSQARKRFSTNRSRPVFQNRLNFNWRQSPYYTPNCDQSPSNPRLQNTSPRTQMSTQQIQNTPTRCRGCRCTNCIQIKADPKDIKKMLEKLSTSKFHEVHEILIDKHWLFFYLRKYSFPFQNALLIC